MVQKVHVVLVDDIDGGDAAETVSFAFDGTAYEIDLSAAHATQFRSAMKPWIDNGRKVSNTKSTRYKRGNSDVAKIRAWAKSRGMDVSERGRISATVREAYNDEH